METFTMSRKEAPRAGLVFAPSPAGSPINRAPRPCTSRFDNSTASRSASPATGRGFAASRPRAAVPAPPRRGPAAAYQRPHHHGLPGLNDVHLTEKLQEE